MSPWILVAVLVLVFWALHAQHLSEKRREAEEELKELRSAKRGLESTLENRGRRLDVLFSAVNEVVMRVDRLGRVMAANSHASNIFDMDSAPKLPQSMLLFYRDPDWQKAFSSALRSLPDSSVLPDMQVGDRILAPRLASLGKKQALLLCVDVTEKQRAEARHKSLYSNLMHDLKTPLTSLLGYARSMEKFGDDAGFRKEAAEVIANEAKHVNQLFDALLTLDQIDASAQGSEESCDAVVVLQQVCEMCLPQAKEKGLVFKYEFNKGNSAPVNILDANLERVLSNLVANAVSYSPVGGTIKLSLQQQGEESIIVIEDEGDGIPEDELPHVTERFYRVDKARSRNVTGHGLGLAIVKELLDATGGTLELSNTEPHGLRAECHVISHT